MQPKLIIAAVVSVLALPALAAGNETPYALSAVHADFQAELEEIAGLPDEVGVAARAAADLMGPHNAAQERLVLPMLAWADAATKKRAAGMALSDAQSLEAELTRLRDGDVELVTALVALYAAAEAAQEPDIARRAERMIWHETGDVEVLYPAAQLVLAFMHPQAASMAPSAIHVGPGPLYGATSGSDDGRRQSARAASRRLTWRMQDRGGERTRPAFPIGKGRPWPAFFFLTAS